MLRESGAGVTTSAGRSSPRGRPPGGQALILEIGPEDARALQMALLDAIHRARNDWTLVSRLYHLHRQVESDVG